MRDGSVLAFFTFWLLWEGLQPRALWIEAEAAPANSGKGGNAPDADAAEPVRCPCGGDAILGSAIHRGSDSCRPARVEGGGPAIPPLRVRFRRDGLQRGGTRTGRFLVWACARIARFTVWFGAGIEPATVGLTVRCSTRLSYPCETYRIRTGDLQSCLLLYQAELTSLRGTPSPDPRHTPRQCRAHRTGMQARTAVERSSMFRIGASDTTSKAPIRVRSHPLSARAEASRHGASLRLRGVSLPRASNARMLRERDAIALDRVIPLCERQNENAPRVLEPEGVRVASGDRGDRSPRCERISRCGWCRDNSACCAVAVHRAVRTRAGPHRAWAMAAVQRCGRRRSWEFDGPECGAEISPRAKVAHVTRALFVWQQNFYITDERWNSCGRAAGNRGQSRLSLVDRSYREAIIRKSTLTPVSRSSRIANTKKPAFLRAF